MNKRIYNVSLNPPLDIFASKSKIPPMKKLNAITVILLGILVAPSLAQAKKPGKEMVKIPKGCFQMGTQEVHRYFDHEENNRERPVHKVCLDSFYIDKYEASQKRFKEIMDRNPSKLFNDDWPADHVRFQDAETYCSLQGKRLPTEAEWEYVARSGSGAENPFGKNFNDYVWHATNSVRTPNPVKSKKANAWGVHNILGNVWEWVSDWYSPSYYKSSPQKNPKGPKDRRSHHVIRGGSWADDESLVRAGSRHPGMADATESFLVGVRCAQSLKGGN
jgi:formylglycine-generating enzyme required for sulfatase activity